jgi:hypothetical protein
LGQSRETKVTTDGVCFWSGAAGWSFQDVSIALASFQVRYLTPNLVAAELSKRTKKDLVVDESTKHQIKVEKN